MKRLIATPILCYMCAWGGGHSFASEPFTQNCNKLDENEQWKTGFTLLNHAFKAGDWKTALNHAKSLEGICNLSPVLNYTIANIHKNMGDEEKYLFYLQKATQNTEQFAVDKDLLNRMWSEKYLAAHPEAAPENIARLHETIDAERANNAALKAELDNERQAKAEIIRNSISKADHLESQIEDYRVPMWIATGVGIAGIAIAAGGAAMVATTNPVDLYFDDHRKNKYKSNITHLAGWTMVGVGSAAAVTGAVFAGIYGYKYKHYKDTQVLSLNITPTWTSIQLTF